MMTCLRRLLFFLLGTGACLMLVLETMDFWTYTTVLSPLSRFLRVADENSTTYLNDEITYEISLANSTAKEDSVANTNVNKSATLKTSSVLDSPVPNHLNRTFPKKDLTTQNLVQDASSKKEEYFLKLLSPEQILRNMSNSLVGAQVQRPRTTRHVLVVSYFRAGSTFMGDLLQQNWRTFYTFEPLHYMSDGLRINDTQLDDALHLLRDLMYCNFSSSLTINYLKWATEQKNNFLLYRNKFLYLTCSRNKELCFRPDFLQYLCNRAPWQVMKLNRLSMEQVGRFVRENPELDIRVLHLVRDPRGIISSRKVMSWCNHTACGDYNVLCQEMNEDHKTFQRLKQLDPRRYFELRYEDLASRPKEISKQVFTALDLPYTETVTNFLNRNTKGRTLAESKNPYSTRRNSYKTAFEWRKKLRLEEIKNVQNGCMNVLVEYDYQFVNSSRQLVGSPQKLYSSQKSWLRR